MLIDIIAYRYSAFIMPNILYISCFLSLSQSCCSATVVWAQGSAFGQDTLLATTTADPFARAQTYGWPSSVWQSVKLASSRIKKLLPRQREREKEGERE